MTIASGNFAELLWPGIKKKYGDNYKKYEPLFTKIFNMVDSDKRFEKFQGVTGLGLASIKDEGNAIPYDNMYQGYQKEYVNVTYALGVIVTREMVEDEQYGYINQIPKFLSKSMWQTKETIAFNHLNNGTNASYTGADGQTLFSASHPLVGGGTYRNQLSTAADLTQTSVEQAIQDIMDWVDDRSLKLRAEPKCLVVPTQFNFQARKLLESAGVIGSADNDVNGIPGLFKDLVVSPYLTDTDECFITTDVENGLTWLTRRANEIGRDNEFDTENLKTKVTERFSSGWTDARGVFTLTGAA